MLAKLYLDETIFHPNYISTKLYFEPNYMLTKLYFEQTIYSGVRALRTGATQSRTSTAAR